MKHFLPALFAFSLLFSLPAFAGWGSDIMSIDSVKHWRMDDKVTHIQGTIIETLGHEGFRISDDTGEIHVRLDNKELKDFHFHTGMRVEVRGRIEHEHHGWDLQANAVKIQDDTIIGN